MRLSFAAKQRLVNCLYDAVKYIVAALNEVAKEDILYLTACVGMWTLYGRVKKNAPDKLLASGVMDVDDLVRLISRLNEGLEVKV
ncbi:MAG: hypothetical protein E7585_01850 [Ruminococcaceae bacterium]|nr:hypothetical protein [Oscillospiraceae bacterium]